MLLQAGRCAAMTRVAIALDPAQVTGGQSFRKHRDQQGRFKHGTR